MQNLRNSLKILLIFRKMNFLNFLKQNPHLFNLPTLSFKICKILQKEKLIQFLIEQSLWSRKKIC